MQLEADALKLMASCFNDLKDEESFVRRTRKLSARFLCQFEQQPEGKALFKSKFSHELGEMKENIFTIVQMMTAYLWSWLWTVNHKKTRYSFNSILQGCFYNVRQIHVIQVRHVQHYWWFWEYFQWSKYHCFGSFVMMYIFHYMRLVSTTRKFSLILKIVYVIFFLWTELPFPKLPVSWALFLQNNQW